MAKLAVSYKNRKPRAASQPSSWLRHVTKIHRGSSLWLHLVQFPDQSSSGSLAVSIPVSHKLTYFFSPSFLVTPPSAVQLG